VEVTKHEPGTFCWIELSTSDRKGAVKFYGDLFGWTSKELPIGDGDVYVFMQKKGKDAAGLHQNKQVPPNWLTYVSVTSADESTAKAKITYFMVDDTDAATKKAQSLGANIWVTKTIENVGRFSVLADPQGAAFAMIKLTHAT
jgi:predicted enzyme related to lactoylglutathione lyase